jgi:hypothetical protein
MRGPSPARPATSPANETPSSSNQTKKNGSRRIHPLARSGSASSCKICVRHGDHRRHSAALPPHRASRGRRITRHRSRDRALRPRYVRRASAHCRLFRRVGKTAVNVHRRFGDQPRSLPPGPRTVDHFRNSHHGHPSAARRGGWTLVRIPPPRSHRYWLPTRIAHSRPPSSASTRSTLRASAFSTAVCSTQFSYC